MIARSNQTAWSGCDRAYLERTDRRRQRAGLAMVSVVLLWVYDRWVSARPLKPAGEAPAPD